MLRTLLEVVPTLLIASALAGAQPGRETPSGGTEKIDGKTDRSLTGFIEKVEAKDEKNGLIRLRTSAPPTRYTFQIGPRTRILTHTSDPLEAGLKSPRLAKAEVRVVFIDRDPKKPGAGQPEIHICRTLQIINAPK